MPPSDGPPGWTGAWPEMQPVGRWVPGFVPGQTAPAGEDTPRWQAHPEEFDRCRTPRGEAAEEPGRRGAPPGADSRWKGPRGAAETALVVPGHDVGVRVERLT